MELRNIGDKELKVWFDGDLTSIVPKLEGPGAVNNRAAIPSTKSSPTMPTAVTLKADESHLLKLVLQGNDNLFRQDVRWNKPGDYTLTVAFHTAVSPVPKGAITSDQDKTIGKVVFTSNTVKLKVIPMPGPVP